LDARLYFNHISKTGGSTLRLLLELQVEIDEIYPYRHPDLGKKKPVEEDLVSGHFPYWYCKTLDPDFESAFKVTILRDPVERYLSYLRAKKRSNRQFTDLESVMNYYRVVSINSITIGLVDNAMCKNLASSPKLQGEALLESAKESLQKFDCVIFFDQYGEGVIDLFRRLGIELHEEEIPTINSTVKEPVSPSLLEEIRQQNLLDIELYEYARTHLQSKRTQYPLRSRSFDDLLRKRSSLDYTFNQPLNGNGWCYREKPPGTPTYRWVMDRPACISFYLEEGIDYELEFNAQVLTDEIVPKVRVNGREIELCKLDDSVFATYQGKIPKEWIGEGETELSFYSLKSFPYSKSHPATRHRDVPPVSFAVSRISISVLAE
jgi:hypothetical protein